MKQGMVEDVEVVGPRRSFILGTAAAIACAAVRLPHALSAEFAISIETAMEPPAWALLEREVLHAHTAACEAFFDRYFDEKGLLMCVARWGGDGGPDDAIENVND